MLCDVMQRGIMLCAIPESRAAPCEPSPRPTGPLCAGAPGDPSPPAPLSRPRGARQLPKIPASTHSTRTHK